MSNSNYKAFATAAFVLFSFVSYSQLIVDEAMTAVVAVVDVLLGEGVQVSNITMNGQPGSELNNQVGYFDSQASNVGICKGIMIASGGVSVAVGPNTSGSASVGSDMPINNDPDLAQLDPDVVNDEAILEFDFIPSSTNISFNFVFASEEYPEFVGSFNDAFGFFLSGPGINGEFSNNAINIALVPETEDFVSINNVNAGQDDLGCMNCEYYVINTNNADPTSNQFDGFTIPLTASAAVIPGETYHIKLAVGDALDSAYDSAVFFQKESFGSGIQSSAGLEDFPGFLGDTTIVEGCNVGNISITWTDLATTDTLFLSYGGTFSEDDLDTDLPDFLVFTVDETTQEIDFGAILDGEDEGTEEIIVSYSYIDECDDTLTVSANLFIIENTPPVLDIPDETICPGSSVAINLFPEDGIGFYQFTLDGETVDPVQTFLPEETTVYDYTVSDPCGNSLTDSFTITVLDEPPLSVPAIDATIFCPGESVTLTSNVTNGYSPYTYEWSGDLASNGDVSEVVATPDFTMAYTLTVTDACGFQEFGNVLVTVEPYVFPSWEQEIFPWCAGVPQIVQNLNGGYGGFTFSSSPGGVSVSGSSDPYQMTNSVIDTLTVTVTATDACFNSTSEDFFIQECELSYYNVFSPNGDGENDFFVISGIEGFPGSKLTIFDRWGKIIYEDSSYSNDWDGKAESGNEVRAGTYYYIFEPANGAEDNKSGFFTLVR